MASEENNNTTISKNNAGFPPYLDFEKLRSESVAYLGKLSGQLWTDHNVHDPGITILEELCYALLDLGYRTNLPVEDILSRNSSDTSSENNFYTPSQILTCNPLTIVDFRKLLIDIPGVRNAWLVPATDIKNICRNDNTDRIRNSCEEFLNGIYHVYIETEADVDKDFENDDPVQEEADKRAFIKDITDKVRKALMAHRNLCEDFADIFILCKLEVGVCASIEIQEGANAENVYVAVANRLRDFFSNVPRFYTLPQLLEKGKPIEDIFAGRPYSKQSHGFVDTQELESIELKKEIHTSDIFNAIFEVEGVRKVSKLELKNCGKDCVSFATEKNSYWKFHLPNNHIPVFSMDCSGFEFTRNGKIVTFDQSKFETQLELGWLHTGKVMYAMPSAYLDSEIPKGIYHADLDSYYSIQNDFPVVYGIGEGDLADSVSDKRKAQALQLKGYLFFFDQMLANYLSQLSNIRQLFSFAHPADKKTQHTYFLNTVTSVPEMNKLLRFGTGESDNGLGTSGTMLAFPVSKEIWQLVDTSQHTAEALLNLLDSYRFDSLFALYESTDLLRNDMVNEGETFVKTYATADDSYLYTIESSTEDFILLSKKISTTESDALRHAASVQYAGVFENNYRSFLTADNHFTFTIELTIDTYTDYLGILVESDELYIKRRKDFLSHLLSRFAEQFTDFVLLNWKPGQENQALQTVEDYLTGYPETSRNRGRAFDYHVYGTPGNSSGFEKKVKALAGIPLWKKNHLCHFTVEPYDESYILDFGSTGITAYQVFEKFDLIEDAVKAASSLISSMGDPSKYTLRYLSEKKEYQLLLDYGSAMPAAYVTQFANSNIAEGLIAYMAKSISRQVPPDAVIEYSWDWVARIKNNEGVVIKTSTDKWSAEDAARNGVTKLVSKINDPKKWKAQKEIPFTGELYHDNTRKDNYLFVDTSVFNIDISDTIVGKPGKFTYDVLDKGTNSFKLRPISEFDSKEDAEQHCFRILVSAANEKNFAIQNTENYLFRVELLLDEKPAAFSAMNYLSRVDAQKAIHIIVQVIRKHSFSLDLLKTPVSWKFRYQLGYEDGNKYTFYSDNDFKSDKKAIEAADLFYKHISDLSVHVKKEAITLAPAKNSQVPSVSYIPLDKDPDVAVKAINAAIDDQHKITHMQSMRKTEELKKFVKVDGVNRFGTFVYRLVNKNNIPASYSEPFSDKETAWKNRKALAAISKKVIRSIPRLCLGGDIFQEVLDASGTLWFRYKIMFYNLQGVPGNQLDLFESVKAFETADKAIEEFYKTYLLVLQLASDKVNYGKYISTTPIDIDDDPATFPAEMLAFIPASTLTILQTNFGATWNEKLIEIVKSYPVKIIDTNSKKFAELFCLDFKEPLTDCAAGKKIWKYYFSIPLLLADQQQTLEREWRSTSYYDTPDEALEDFRYFSRLLLFTGNYFTDCACTKTVIDGSHQSKVYNYKIFIREVLAQSVDWFEREEDAWGARGIEKFICAAQNGRAFKNYQRKEDCCYSFYVTCGNGLLEHPCKYDTEIQRDHALEGLYKAMHEFVKNKSFGYTTGKGHVVLNDQEGKHFAQVVVDQSDPKDRCDWFIHLAEQLFGRTGTVIYEKDGALKLTINSGEIIIHSVERRENLSKADQDTWIDQWGKTLWYWACYFPISRTRVKSDTSSNIRGATISYKYCIEIKLPGFNLCGEDEKPYQPCGCDAPNESDTYCYIAWKGKCCYSSCAEALRALELALKLLLDKNNYHSIFDCDCYSFGIALHSILPSLVGPQTPALSESDIIAINPQCNETSKEVCDAVDTAWQLINSQGMHLVEHILLRPYTQADCECRNELADCDTDCKFPDYIAKGSGACSEEDQSICFNPGTDPYSFIATVVLPAWSDKFRTKADRILLENLLYREAPAHVLLRILWLKPVDFCGFEGAYIDWKKWMAGLDGCNNDFSICNFIDLLFLTRYDCLSDCTECIPCTDPDTPKPLNCLEEASGLKRLQNRIGSIHSLDDNPFEFLNQVNKTYCFYSYCESATITEDFLRKDISKKGIELEKTIPANDKLTTTTEKSKSKKDKEQPEVKAPVSEKKIERPPLSGVEIQLMAQAVNARFRKYKTAVAGVQEQTGGNPLAAKIDRYISSQQADVQKLDAVLAEVIQNAKTTGKVIKHLAKKQQLNLIKVAVCFYLDKVSFNGKNEASYSQLLSVIQRLEKADIDLQSIYNYWDAAEVVKVDPDLDIDYVRHIITGKKK